MLFGGCDGQVYGGAEAWPLLEEGSYRVVQEQLFEKQEEEEKKQLLLEHHPQEEEQQGEVGQEPPQVILSSLRFPECSISVVWIMSHPFSCSIGAFLCSFL